MIISLPEVEDYKGKWFIIPSPCIFSLQSTTLSDYSTDLHNFTVTVNIIEVTANTCTCTDRCVYNNNKKGPIRLDI